MFSEGVEREKEKEKEEELETVADNESVVITQMVEDEIVKVPNAQFIADKLLERGYTYEDLVKCILWAEHSGPEDIYDDYLKRSVTVYSTIRHSIRKFQENINCSVNDTNGL
jgi:hypothetical protein